VLLENNAQEQLIFKHAISTVVSGRVGPHAEGRMDAKPEARAQGMGSGAAAAGAVVNEAAGVTGD
jgi:host factor-I protein